VTEEPVDDPVDDGADGGARGRLVGTVSAVVTRADGTVEDLGVISVLEADREDG